MKNIEIKGTLAYFHDRIKAALFCNAFPSCCHNGGYGLALGHAGTPSFFLLSLLCWLLACEFMSFLSLLYCWDVKHWTLTKLNQTIRSLMSCLSLSPLSFMVLFLDQSGKECYILASGNGYHPTIMKWSCRAACWSLKFCVSVSLTQTGHWVHPRCWYQTFTPAHCFCFRPAKLQFHHWAALFSSCRNVDGDLMLSSPVAQLAPFSPIFQCHASRSQ